MIHKPYLALVILPLLLLIATSAHAGKIYKWTDKSGEVHYTQTPPPDMHSQEMKISPAAPQSSEPSKTDSQKTAAKEKNGKTTAKGQAQKQAAVEKKNEEIRKENCKRANKRFRTINAGGRLYDVNEKGERVYWDDDKRASELSDAQQSVEKWCNE